MLQPRSPCSEDICDNAHLWVECPLCVEMNVRIACIPGEALVGIGQAMLAHYLRHEGRLVVVVVDRWALLAHESLHLADYFGYSHRVDLGDCCCHGKTFLKIR